MDVKGFYTARAHVWCFRRHKLSSTSELKISQTRVESLPNSLGSAFGFKSIPIIILNMIFYAIYDKSIGICVLITQKVEKLTNCCHFRLEVSVCSASAVGASENFWHVTGE